MDGEIDGDDKDEDDVMDGEIGGATWKWAAHISCRR